MRNKHSAVGFLIVALLFAVTTGCGQGSVQVVQPPDTREEDAAAIQVASKEWSDAAGAKDLTKCLSFYAEGAERLATGSYIITGKEAFRTEWEKILAVPQKTSWVPSKIEVARSGDLAYEMGAYEAKTVDKKKQPVISTGKYVFVWEKQEDGEWKVVEDIDTPDK